MQISVLLISFYLLTKPSDDLGLAHFIMFHAFDFFDINIFFPEMVIVEGATKVNCCI